MTEKTKQKGMPLWLRLGVIGIIALVGGSAILIAYEFATLELRVSSNLHFIESQGFNAEKGYFSGYDPFVRISDLTYFLTLAHNWNVTTIFVDTGDGEMFFVYQGLIYAHY